MAPNFSVVSRGEIITGIRQAKNQKIQKKIFAELCCCSVSEIEKIIQEDEQMKYWSEKDIATLQELCEEGKSRSEIAEFFGRDEKSVENKIYDLRRKGIIKDKSKDDVKFQKQKAKKPSSTPLFRAENPTHRHLFETKATSPFPVSVAKCWKKSLLLKTQKTLNCKKKMRLCKLF